VHDVAALGRKVLARGEGEPRSWEASLPVLTSLLVQAGLGGHAELVEYRLPLSSKSVDELLVGCDVDVGNKNMC
jgi:hypothetical protein